MRFRSLRLKDFRGFEDVSIDLDRNFTVLAGANGSGKTSVLEACAFIQSIIFYSVYGRADLVVLVPDGDEVRHGTQRSLIETKLSDRDHPLDLTLEIMSGEPGSQWIQRNAHPLIKARFGDEIPLLIFFGAQRTTEAIASLNPQVSANAGPGNLRYEPHVDALHPSVLRVAGLVAWIQACQIIENDEKVTRKDFGYEDWRLSAVRRAVREMLPGIDDLRIQQEPFRLTVQKRGQTLTFEQLSDGEAHLLALAGDLARRLALAATPDVDPLTMEAVVLIDEIETHLHPAWQRRVPAALQRAFPAVQFIVTTHSPQVLSELPSDAVVLLDDFRPVAHAPTQGRDSNAILTEFMGVPERPVEDLQTLQEVGALIDHGDYGEARARIERIATRLSERDRDIVRYRNLLHVLEGDA